MLNGKQQHRFLPPDPVARVFSLDHARRDKAALLAADADTERRHPSRLLDGLNWPLVVVLAASAAWNLLAVIGAAWLIGRLIASIEAGVWL